MRSSLEQMERISRYLSGTLSPEERAGFEAEVDGDPVLREQLDFQQDITRVMQRRVLRSEINTVAKHYGGASSGFSWMAMAVSGVVVVAGVTGFLLFSSGKEPQKQQQQTVEVRPDQHTAAATSTTVTQPAAAVRPEKQPAIRFGKNDPISYAGSVMTMSLQEAAAIGLLPGSGEKTRSYTFVSDPEQLDLLPEGFSNEVLAQVPASERREWNRQRLSELYYSLGNTATDVEKGDLGYIAVRSWRKPVKMRIPVGMMKRSDYKSKAFGMVVDEKGDGLKNVEIEFLAYGDKRKVTTDAEGHFSFGLYGKIVTEATFSVPGYGSAIMPKAQFQAGRQTWFQVELPVTGPKGKKKTTPIDDQTGGAAEAGSCSISPAAVKALYAPEFIGTYIATKEFEKRIKALHVLDNGQQLLDIYVDNLTQPLWKVDQLVADRLTGDSRKLFEGFSAERSESSASGLKDQAWYSSRYRDMRRVAGQECKAPANTEKALLQHMQQFVAPCTGESEPNTPTKEETERD